MESLSSFDKENGDAITKKIKSSKQSVLRSISLSQDANKKNITHDDTSPAQKRPFKQVSITSNIVPVKTRLDAQKYKVQFPGGPMGLILEPVVSSYGSLERHIGGKVKGFRFSDVHSDLFREVVQASLRIGDIVFAINDKEVDWMPFDDIMAMLEPLARQSKAIIFKCLSADRAASAPRSLRRRESNRKKEASPAPSTPDTSPTKIFRQLIQSDVASPLSIKSLSPGEDSYAAVLRREMPNTEDRSFTGRINDLKCDMASEAADRDAWRSRALMAEEALVELRSQLVTATSSKNDYCAQLESELTIEQNSIKALLETLETERNERAAEQMELSGELNRMKEEQKDLREDMRSALRNAAAEYRGMEAERDKAVAELEALRDAMSAEKSSLEKERQRMRESMSSVQKGHIDKLIAFENDLSDVKHELATVNGQLERTTALYHEALAKTHDIQASFEASCEETQRARSTISRLESEVRSLKIEVEHAQQDIDDRNEDITHWKTIADKLRQEMSSHNKRNESLQQDITEKNGVLSALQEQVSKLNEQCDEKDAALSTLQQQYDTLELNTAQTIEKNNALMQRIRNRATAHETELLQALSAAEAEHGSLVSEFELKISMLTKEVEKVKNSESLLRKELDMERRKFSDILDRQEEQNASNQEECVKLKKSLAVAQGKFDVASKSLVTLTTQLEEAAAENSSLRSNLAEVSKQLEDEVSKVHRLEQVIVRMGNEAEASKTLQVATQEELQSIYSDLKRVQDENKVLSGEICESQEVTAKLSTRITECDAAMAYMQQQLESSESASREKSNTIDNLQVSTYYTSCSP